MSLPRSVIATRGQGKTYWTELDAAKNLEALAGPAMYHRSCLSGHEGH